MDAPRLLRRPRTRALAAVGAVALALGLAGPAGADIVYNDADATIDVASEHVAVTAGTSASVKLKVDPTNGDGKNGCNLTSSSTLVVAVASSATSRATVTPSSVTFTSCGDEKTLIVTGVSAGAAVVSLTQTSNGTSGTFDLAPATFQVDVAAACVAPAAPTLAALSAPGASGWYTATSGVAGFSITPATGAQYDVDGAGWTPYTGPVTFSTDGVRSVLARTVTTPQGCAAQTSPATAPLVQRVDRTAPSIGVGALPAANATGWNNQVLQAVWSCSDTTSGLAAGTCPATETFGDGAEETARTVTITDVAGNAATATRRAVRVDASAPVVEVDIADPTGQDGWDDAVVRATYRCQDGTSGVVDCPADEVFDQDGSPYGERTVTVTDAAGNTSAPVTRRAVQVDSTVPSAVAALSSPANGNGWHDGPVTVTWTCSDAGGSGVAWCPPTEELVDDGRYDEVTDVLVTDVAGNQAEAVRPLVQIDTVAPTTDYVVTDGSGHPVRPSESGWYTQHLVVTFTCSDFAGADDASGVEADGPYACPAPLVVDAEGATPAQQLQVRDRAGNEATISLPEFRIDTTRPTLSVVVSPAANAAGWNTGPVTVDWTCADAGSGVDCLDDATIEDGEIEAQSFTVTDVAGNVSVPVVRRAIRIDRSPPQVEVRLLDASGQPLAPNENGWFGERVTLDVACRDDESRLVDDCTSADTFADGEFGDFDVTATDVAGNVTTVHVPVLRIDTIAPELTVDVSPAPNGAGWNREAVQVDVTCTDGGSGVVGCPADEVVESGTRPATELEVSDLAGNTSASVARREIKVDRVVPVLDVVVRGGDGEPASANANGWFSEHVLLDVTCTDDGGSGLVQSGAGACPADEPVGDGVHPSRSFGVWDVAGNSGGASVPQLQVDTVAPVVTALGATAAPGGTNGWYRSPVTARFLLSDGLSGFAGETDPHVRTATTTGEGAALQLSSGAAQDLAGNVTAAVGSGPFKVDLAAPSGVAFTSGPAAGGAYPVGSVPVAPSCTADGGVSGLAACVVTGWSTAVGEHTLVATAIDGAGWTSTATRTYRVQYRTTGFYQPVDMGSVVNTVKGGSTVPLKFEVFGAAGEVSSTAAVTGVRFKETACGTLGPLPEDAIETLATGGTALRYDSTAGQFVYNWQTPKTVGRCYTTSVTLDDGGSITAYFKTK